MASTTSPPLSTTLHDGTITSWLPLTTPWPSNALSECSSQIYTWSDTLLVFDPVFRTLQTDNPDLYCQPPEVTASWHQSHQTPQLTTTSLEGLACPELYTTAWSTSIDTASQYVVCCPNSFTPEPSYQTPATSSRYCSSRVTKGQKLGIYGNTTSDASFWFTKAVTTLQNDDILSAPQINGYALLTTSTSAAATAATGTGTGTGGSTPSNSAPAATSGSAGSGGLSTGAKAGIGAGVGALGILALVGAFFLMRRKRSKMIPVGSDEHVGGDHATQRENMAKVAPSSEGGPYYTSVKTELPAVGAEGKSYTMKSELQADDAGVVRANSYRQEPVYEMSEDRGVARI